MGNGPKIGFFVFQEKFILFSCTNFQFEKNVVPEIQAKVLSAIQIVEFLSQAFLQSKSMKQPHFLYVDTNSQKLKVDWKVFGEHGPKWECGPSDLWTQKVTVSQERTDGTNFLHAGTISHIFKGDWTFSGWAWSKMSVASLVMDL